MRSRLDLHNQVPRSTALASRSFNDFRGPGFDAPTLETVNLAFSVVFFLATLFQFFGGLTYFCRGRSPHLLPGCAAIVVFVVVLVSKGLDITYTILSWTFNQDSGLIVNQETLLKIEVFTILFDNWINPGFLTVIALVLRDRYRTYTEHATQTLHRPLPLLAFTLLSCFLIALSFVMSIVGVGIYGDAYTAYYRLHSSSNQLNSKVGISFHFFYAFDGSLVVTTIFLYVFATMVQRRAKGDRITSVILFWIMPFLVICALSRVIFEIINAVLPGSPIFTDVDAFAIDLADTVVYGVLFFIVGCMVLYFLLAVRLWRAPEPQPQYTGYMTQQFHPLGSMQLPAQCPAQSGSTAQPQDYLVSRPSPATNDDPSPPKQMLLPQDAMSTPLVHNY